MGRREETVSNRQFLNWYEGASAGERADGIERLAQAVIGPTGLHDRAGVVDALLLAIDDPSPKVRLRLAETLAPSSKAPLVIVEALLCDTPAVAGVLVRRSPLLSEAHLIDLVAMGDESLQMAVAGRPRLSARVSAALAEVGGLSGCLALLDNTEAEIARVSIRRLAERFGVVPRMRDRLLQRGDLPADIRQMLIRQLGAALSEWAVSRSFLEEERARRIAREACERATIALAQDVGPQEVPALAEHLRASGQLTTAFLLRAVCFGHIDLFAAALVSLSGRSARRVRSVLVDGGERSFDALLSACGLAAPSLPLFRCAVQVWKELTTETFDTEIDDLPRLVMERVVRRFHETGDRAGYDATAAYMHHLATDAARDSARARIRRLAA